MSGHRAAVSRGIRVGTGSLDLDSVHGRIAQTLRTATTSISLSTRQALARGSDEKKNEISGDLRFESTLNMIPIRSTLLRSLRLTRCALAGDKSIEQLSQLAPILPTPLPPAHIGQRSESGALTVPSGRTCPGSSPIRGLVISPDGFQPLVLGHRLGAGGDRSLSDVMPLIPSNNTPSSISFSRPVFFLSL
jgi:hypothetical protein